MHWDIDKSLADLMTSETLDPSITKVLVDRTLWKSYNVKPKDSGQQSAMVWCIALGRHGCPKLMTYGLTIREAYLKARKSIKTLSAQDLGIYGLKNPKKQRLIKAPKRKEVHK
jgi:hypothetical protein